MCVSVYVRQVLAQAKSQWSVVYQFTEHHGTISQPWPEEERALKREWLATRRLVRPAETRYRRAVEAVEDAGPIAHVLIPAAKAALLTELHVAVNKLRTAERIAEDASVTYFNRYGEWRMQIGCGRWQ